MEAINAALRENPGEEGGESIMEDGGYADDDCEDVVDVPGDFQVASESIETLASAFAKYVAREHYVSVPVIWTLQYMTRHPLTWRHSPLHSTVW